MTETKVIQEKTLDLVRILSLLVILLTVHLFSVYDVN